ncbi:MAG: hypothetical protein IJV64_12620 [Oscillospiraceae bacterium]|nr:hypothetical protein [Oscillospiraceae bacterium]
MSALQEQAVQMIRSLPDGDVRFFIDVLRRLAPNTASGASDSEERLAAVDRLAQLGQEIRNSLPKNWDPETELTEALDEKYGID